MNTHNPGWLAAPALRDSRISLEPLHTGHDAGIYGASDSDEIFRWLPFARPRSVDEAGEVRQFYLGRDRSLAWAIVEDEQVVGLTGFYAIDPAQRSLSVGATWLRRSAWGSDVNLRSKRLLLRYAFNTLECVRAVFEIDTFNGRSLAATKRLGAVHEGVARRQRRRRDGSWRDVHVLSIVDTDLIASDPLNLLDREAGCALPDRFWEPISGEAR